MKLAAAAFALAFASVAHAQPASSLAQLQMLRSTNTRVTVTDRNGREFRGTIADASNSLLSLRIADAIQQFSAEDVRSVRARVEDPLLNGALIGASVGGGLTALAFLDNECRDDPACYGAVAVYAGTGALAGLAIDVLIHRDVVLYTAPAGARRTFMVTPFAARGRTGVRLAVAF